jgi:hypothetical protein
MSVYLRRFPSRGIAAVASLLRNDTEGNGLFPYRRRFAAIHRFSTAREILYIYSG